MSQWAQKANVFSKTHGFKVFSILFLLHVEDIDSLLPHPSTPPFQQRIAWVKESLQEACFRLTTLTISTKARMTRVTIKL
jgi:hypothetical protein